MAVNASSMIHIEVVVRNADEAYQFLNRVFGARKVQKEFATFLEENFGAKVIHVALGGVVLQFIEPTGVMVSWSEQLKEKGPGVHNLTFEVDNLEKTVKLLEQEGAPVLEKFSVDWSKVIDSVKPGSEYPGYMINSMEKVGFNLELVGETPEEVLDLLQIDNMAVNASSMIHIEVVVRNADEAYQFLNRVFGARKVQKEFATFLEENFGAKVIHVALGGVVLQFIEPTGVMVSWSEQLKEKGPGVHNLTFEVDNLEKTVKLLEQEGAPVLEKFSVDWSKVIDSVKPGSEYPGYMINSMEKVGFNLELVGETPEEVLDLLQIDNA